MASSAAAQVCAIPELLENILIHLTQPTMPPTADDSGARAVIMKHFFVMQRINFTFRNTIKSSKQLRRFMFLEAEQSERGSVNPLCKKFRGHGDIVLPLSIGMGGCVSLSFVRRGYHHNVFCNVEARSPDSSEMWPTASWRKMRITNDSQYVVLQMHKDHYDITMFGYTLFKPGFTLGALFDAVKNVRKSGASSESKGVQ